MGIWRESYEDRASRMEKVRARKLNEAAKAVAESNEVYLTVGNLSTTVLIEKVDAFHLLEVANYQGKGFQFTEFKTGSLVLTF